MDDDADAGPDDLSRRGPGLGHAAPAPESRCPRCGKPLAQHARRCDVDANEEERMPRSGPPVLLIVLVILAVAVGLQLTRSCTKDARNAARAPTERESDAPRSS